MSDASFRAARRLFNERANHPHFQNDAGALEATTRELEPARLIASDVIEDVVLRVRQVTKEPVAAFGAFLDGTQRSRVVVYRQGIPVVHGTVGAAIRSRRERRLHTWRAPVIRERLYAPKAYLSPDDWARASDDAFAVVDITSPDPQGVIPSPHPYELLACAVHAVQLDRERAELDLAELWCAAEATPLYVDGGISRSERVATSPLAVGVVKSHRSLYVAESALREVYELPRGARTSVFVVTSLRRTPVASWYLRLREPGGRDPMFGLVRIEIAAPGSDAAPAALSRRADEVSRWVLAERLPLALPDGRWPAMAYGVRDVEEYLRAVSP